MLWTSLGTRSSPSEASRTTSSRCPEITHRCSGRAPRCCWSITTRSWETILRKRHGYLSAFAGFDPRAVAGFDQARIDALVPDPASAVRLHFAGSVIWARQPEPSPLMCGLQATRAEHHRERLRFG